MLRLLLPELRNRGYKIVTLSELEDSLSNTVELRPPEELPLLLKFKRTSALSGVREN